MHKLMKKFITIFICLIFLISAFITSSATILKEEQTTTSEEDVPTDLNVLEKEIVVYRYGLDGSITPINVIIKLEKNQDIGEAIADKCDELTESDTEIQALINKVDKNTTTILTKISSFGRGFHFKTKIRLQILQRLKLFPFLPPYLRTAIFIPTNFCRYPRDPHATTQIKVLKLGKNLGFKNLTIEGPHSVLTLGFIGFTGWIGHISHLGYILRTGFAGFTLFARCKRL